MKKETLTTVKRLDEALKTLSGVAYGLENLGPQFEAFVLDIEAVVTYLETISSEYTVDEVKGKQLDMFGESCEDLPLFSGTVVRK